MWGKFSFISNDALRELLDFYVLVIFFEQL